MLVGETTQARQDLSQDSQYANTSSNPTPRLQMYHKFESQLHFRLHWHLKLDFMVDESDAVLEVTQDNPNPSLSLQKIVSLHRGKFCVHIPIQFPCSLSFLYPPPHFDPIHTGVFLASLETHIKWCSASTQRQFACFGNQPDIISQFLKHPHAPAQMQ